MNDKLKALVAEIAPLITAMASAMATDNAGGLLLNEIDFPAGELTAAQEAIEDRARELMSEIKKLSDAE